MSSLLSDAEFAEARLAMNDACDTFMQMPITYYKYKGNMDLNEEGTTPSYDTYTFMVMKRSALSDFGKVVMAVEGAQDEAGIKLQVKLDALDDLGLITTVTVNGLDSYVFAGNAANDYIVVEGFVYTITEIAYKGQWKNRPVVVLIYGKKNEAPS